MGMNFFAPRIRTVLSQCGRDVVKVSRRLEDYNWQERLDCVFWPLELGETEDASTEMMRYAAYSVRSLKDKWIDMRS